ncbi:MAG: aspartate-semialdehyde dehydrogenase [Oscillospiraceae bacterium]|nr:aspartate-semialdehyde dehydrogenase [Oscillospiraceae bacterium]
MKKLNAGIIGATGMVGQRFALLLENHPWFEVTALAASPRSAGKAYGELMENENRWMMEASGGRVPENMKNMTVLDASDISSVASKCDFVFCAVDMKKDEIIALEEAYARAECPVISNNSAHRKTPDVPMIIPEVNPGHAEVIHAQRKRLGTKRGFIAVKSNCSIQSYVPALHPLLPFGVKDVLACTYQAVSGAGKKLCDWEEMQDNVIPYIGGGEEEKSEKEPLKIWGKIEDGVIRDAAGINITAQCVRVPVSDGHLAAVYVRFENKPGKEEIIKIWNGFGGLSESLPSAPEKFLTYFEEESYPQTKLHRGLYNGMGVAVGRLREDSQYDYKFIGLSHNTLRGAAGGAVLTAELLMSKGYFD